ncbi:MAG: potassium channel family protein [Pseudomonadota bacterium]
MKSHHESHYELHHQPHHILDDARLIDKKSHRLRLRVFARRGLMYSLALSMAILFLGGAGFWFIDPQITRFGDGLWLAFTTAATVGYGDLVPSTHASKVFAVVVVLFGLAVLSLVTASMAAIFVETEERDIERELMREIRALRGEVAEIRQQLSRRSATD